MKTNNPFRAMVITLITALSLSCMAVFVKLLAHQVEISQVILFRFGSGLIYILGLALWTRLRDRKISFPPRAPFKFHFARAFFGVVSMFFFYSTFKFMPLVDSTLLMMTAPLFLPIFSWIIWRERTSWQVVLAIIFGFIGLVFILRPDSAVFHQGALWGLGGGAFAALAILSLKRATLDDPPMTILLCYFPLAVLMSGLVCLFSWMPLTWHLVLLLLGVGFFGTIYQEGLVRACQYAPPSLVTTVMYTSVVFSGLLEFFLWDHIPGWNSWIGSLIVCASGSWTVFHLRKSSGKR